jgi:hypothetical protein
VGTPAWRKQHTAGDITLVASATDDAGESLWCSHREGETIPDSLQFDEVAIIDFVCAAKVAQSPSWNRDSAARAFRARSESHGAPCAA